MDVCELNERAPIPIIKIRIQNVSFEVIGVIESLPDISGFFLFGDQALINKSGFNNLTINNLGSFINFKYKIIKKENNSKLPKKIYENQKIKIKNPKVIKPFIILGLSCLPRTASQVKNIRCPPSRTGIGNKLIMPMAVDKTAINHR